MLWLPLTLHHWQMQLQWCVERRTWTTEWHDIIFSDESRFCLQHQDGRIRVWRHRGERLYDTCIRHCHTAPSPGVMVWGAIGFVTRARLVRIAGTLNSHRYISDVLEPVVRPYLQELPADTFQQDNARPHVARTVQRFFTDHQVSLLPWPVCSPDMSPIKQDWSLSGNRVARQAFPAATPDELWHRVEAAWTDILQADIQRLFCSMPQHVAAVIASHGGHMNY
ncbi:transposase [Salmonella enterica subsp. enterica serovar Derby]|nr:transposase [Salmonella enterica subsp. enterica serovar Derby]